MSQEFIDSLWGLLAGSGGASVVIATIMGYIKSAWKPEPKWKYWLIAGPLSILAAGGIMWYLQYWNLLVFAVSSIIVASAQLFENNELWPHVKSVFELLLKRMAPKKDKE